MHVISSSRNRLLHSTLSRYKLYHYCYVLSCRIWTSSLSLLSTSSSLSSSLSSSQQQPHLSNQKCGGGGFGLFWLQHHQKQYKFRYYHPQYNTRRTIMTTTTTTTTTATPVVPIEEMMEKEKQEEQKKDGVIEEKKMLRKTIREKLKQMSLEQIRNESSTVWNQLYQVKQYKHSQSIGLFLSMPFGEIHTEELIQNICTNTATTNTPVTLYVPVVGKNFEKADMELLQVTNIVPISSDEHDTNNNNDDAINTKNKNDNAELFYNTWPRNRWNIPEPPDEMLLLTHLYAKPGDLDLIIVPGLAFDRYGNRLGQGKGYYDRFLSRMIMIDDNVDNDTVGTSTTKTKTKTTTSKKKKKKPYLVGVGLDCQLLPVGQRIPTNEYDFPLDAIIVPSETIIIDPNKK